MSLKFCCLSFFAIIAFFTMPAFSATKTWTGNGTDNKFTNPANWAENSAAAYGDDLIFPAVSAQFSASCDLIMIPGNNQFQYFKSITIQGGNYTIGGSINISQGSGLIINSGNQNFSTLGVVISPSITVAQDATITALISTRYSSFSINGAGNSTITAWGSTGNNITKNDSGTADVRWVDSNQLNQITVNGGKFIARGGIGGGLFSFIVTNGTVEGYTGSVNSKISFNGSNSIYKLGGFTSTPTIEFLNGAQLSPISCLTQIHLVTTVNLTGAVFNPLYTSCDTGVVTIFNVIGSNPSAVNGFFTNYPEGSTLNIGGKTYRMTYKGGDGNDVQLIKIPRTFDFDGDTKADVSIFRPSSGEWWYARSSDGNYRTFSFGTSSDKIVPADYTGDEKTDVAVWRPSTGEWFVLRSDDFSFYSFPFGANGDTPAPADFDGDGKSDAAVFRSSNNTWYIQKSTGGVTIQPFGTAGDKPVPADYDGDGKTDIAVFRPTGAEWWINTSSNNQTVTTTFGTSNDKPVQGDYTGDGKTDIAVWRPSNGNWFILRSEDSTFYAFPFGITTDIPAPGDFDGDGRTDATIFRPSNANWYSNRSTAGISIIQFGLAADTPIPNAFVP